MRRRLAVLFLVFSVLAIAIPGAAEPAGPIRGTTTQVLGHVVDARGKAIDNARIELIQYGIGTVASRQTLSDGNFAIDLLSPDPQPLSIRVWAGGYRVADSSWFPTGTQKYLSFVLSPIGVTVRGTVQDLDGKPISGADVEYLQPDGRIAARGLSDQFGVFRLTVPERAENAVLRVMVRGYRPISQPIPATEASIDIRLAPARGVVSGRVLSGAGLLNISGARIFVLGKDGSFIWEGSPGSGGRFEVSLPTKEEAYLVTAWAPGANAASAEVRVEGGKRKAMPPFVLDSASARIRGRVLEPNGRLKAGVTVTLDQQGIGTIATAVTDAQGRYTFKGVLVGPTYRVGVTDVVGWTPITSNWVTVSAGQEVLADLRLFSTGFLDTYGVGTLAGRIADPEGRPIADAAVTARRLDNWQTFTARTDEQGDFRLEPIPATAGIEGVSLGYWVTVAKDGYFATSQLEGTDSNGFVTITSNQTTYLAAIMRPSRRDMAGTVVDDLARPLPGALVRLIRVEDGKEISVQTDEQGTFRLPEMGASSLGYIVTVTKLGYLFVDAPGLKPSQLVGNEPNELELRVRSTSATVRGRIADSQGKPVQNGKVIARGTVGSFETDLDEGGAFAVRLPVEEGPFAFTFRLHDGRTFGYTDGDNDGLVLFQGHGGQALSTLQVPPASAYVIGRVLKAVGSPASNMTVLLEREGSETARSTKTDQEGRFLFEVTDWVPGFHYSLRVPKANELSVGIERSSGLPSLFRLEGGQTYRAELVVSSDSHR